MKIFHASGLDIAIPLIAREIINLEYRKIVYDITLMDYPWNPYFTLKCNDNEFTIDIREGLICIPIHSSPNKIINALTQELLMIDIQLEKYPPNLIPIGGSNNNCRVGISCYVESTELKKSRRVFYKYTEDADKFENYLYSWKIITYDHLLEFGCSLTDMLKSYSCILWDPKKIFKFSNMEFIQNFPTMDDLKNNKITPTKYTFHHIFGIKWHIFQGRKFQVKKLKQTVYDESYDNVDLLNFDEILDSHSPEDKINTTIVGINNIIKNLSKLQIKLENESKSENESKNESKNESVKKVNDICYICKILLYDDIYVVEVILILTKLEAIHLLGSSVKSPIYLPIHFGLCSICGSNPEIIKKPNSINPEHWQLLRVKYPRTFKEVLQQLNFSKLDVNIMSYINDLHEVQTLNYDGRYITGPNLVSYTYQSMFEYIDDLHTYRFKQLAENFE